MATVKRINGDYTLKSASPSDNINILSNELNITADVSITGDLTVVGSLTQTQLNIEQTTISDPFITLGAGNDGSINEIGIEVQKDGSSKAGLRWNTAMDRWEISKDNAVWEPIVSGSAGFSLIDDPDPTLSSTLKTNGYMVYDGIGNLTLASYSGEIAILTALRLPHRSPPAPQAGYTKIHAGLTATGRTGLYISSFDSDLNQVQEELISKSQAIIYSIIF